MARNSRRSTPRTAAAVAAFSTAVRPNGRSEPAATLAGSGYFAVAAAPAANTTANAIYTQFISLLVRSPASTRRPPASRFDEL